MKPLRSVLLLSSTIILPFAAASFPRPPPVGQLPVMPGSPPPSDSSGAPGGDGDNNNNGPSTQPGVALTDILGTHRSLTTFSSLARQHASTSSLLADMRTNTTVLAPLNSAVDALPRKPWEDPRDFEDGAAGAAAYEGDDGRDRAERNLRRFVEAHLVTASPWPEGESGRAETVAGEGKARALWWVTKDGKRVIMPDEVEVDRVASQVGNGEVWILKGVLNYY